MESSYAFCKIMWIADVIVCKLGSEKCSTPSQLLICSLFSEENGHLGHFHEGSSQKTHQAVSLIKRNLTTQGKHIFICITPGYPPADLDLIRKGWNSRLSWRSPDSSWDTPRPRGEQHNRDGDLEDGHAHPKLQIKSPHFTKFSGMNIDKKNPHINPQNLLCNLQLTY